MEIRSLVDIFVNIFNAIIICSFVAEMQTGLVKANSLKEFIFYVVAIIIGIFVLIYDVGRVVIIWLF